MKKTICVLLLIALTFTALFALVACNPTDTEWYVEEGAEVINVYLRDFEDWSNNYTIDAIRRFNKDLTDGIQVEYTLLLEDQYENKVQSDREAGKAPDVYLISYGNLLTAINYNYILPLEDVLSQKMQDDISQSARNYVYLRDHLYAAPFCFEPSIMLFYSKSAFEKAGVKSAPKTYAEMLDACAKIKPTLNKAQYVVGTPKGLPLGWANIGQFYNAAGGHLPISDDWSESLVMQNKDGYKAFLDYYTQLYIKGYTPLQDSAGGYNEIIREVCEGRAAMTFAGSYAVSTIYDEYPECVDDIEVAVVPTRNGTTNIATTTNGGWSYVIDSAAAKRVDEQGRTHAQLAAKFLEFLLTDPVVAPEYFEKANYCKSAGYDSVIAALGEKGTENKFYSQIALAASNAIATPLYNYDITTECSKMIEEIVINGKTADQVIAAFDVSVKQIIKNSGLAGKNPALPQK